MDVVAQTSSGAVRGKHRDGVLLFCGIPYANPPTGTARFRMAEPHRHWSPVRRADRFGPAAPQKPSGTLTDRIQVKWNEDCLFLNISTPALDDAGRPVLFWIHGGGYRSGQAAVPWYDGTRFCLNGDLVVVSINYRLGALGFTDISRFGEEYATSGVNGLLDQIIALEWVRENITGFGGDPGKITIAGESAGAFAVGSLLGSPRARGLFHRAILQSGAAHHTLAPHEGERIADLLLDELGVRQVEDILAVTAEEILQAQHRVDVRIQGARDHTGQVPAFYPVTGNVVLPVDPLEAIRDGAASEVDVLIGTNRDEATLFINGEVSSEKLERDAARYGGDRTLVDAYRTIYPDADNRAIAVAMATDHMFRVPAIRLAEARSGHSGRTWMYRFDWESRNAQLKSTHALEIPFVFDNLRKPGVDVFLGEGDLPQALALEMHAAWTGFVREGRPGWEPWKPEDRVNMIFDTRSGIRADPDSSIRSVWDGVR